MDNYMKERNRSVVNSNLDPNSPLSDLSLSNSHKDDIRTPNEQSLTRPQKPKVV